MKAIYKKRLLKLAEHLETGKLEHKKFYFAYINVDSEFAPLVTNGCGYAGCALGECAAVFPTHFKWSRGWPRLKVNDLGGMDAAPSFFGISWYEVKHLFVPYSQCPEDFGGRVLGNNATRKQVARNIRAFLAKKEANAKQPT